MTDLPRQFCPDCVKPIKDGEGQHGMYGEHTDCYKARQRGEFPSETGRNWSQPLKDAIFDPEWKPKPDPLIGVGATGWLAPDGKFYACRAYVHIALGEALDEYFYGNEKDENDPSTAWRRHHGSSVHLEQMRWAHIAEHGVYWRTDDRDRGPTQAQRDTLWDWFVEIKDKLSTTDRDQRASLWTLERLFRPDEEDGR